MELELLTHCELASRLKVSVRTVRRMAAAGTIPGRQVGGRVRFSWPEVVASLPVSGPVQAVRRYRTLAGRGPMPMVEHLKQVAREWHVVPDELAAMRRRKGVEL